jgi:hypothetical protein
MEVQLNVYELLGTQEGRYSECISGHCAADMPTSKSSMS